MPIDFQCPDCKKRTLVPDDLAGQTGPCSGCGKTVTVPIVGKVADPQSPLLIMIPLAICVSVALMVIVALAAAVMLPAMQAQRAAAANVRNVGQLQNLGIALHNYHDVHKTFPPAYIANEDGSRRTSWRVLLLPYVQADSIAEMHNPDKDWDHPANRILRNTVVEAFAAPDGTPIKPQETSYVLITGPGTAFDGAQAVKIDDLGNNAANVAIAVRVRNLGIEWSEPRDIPVSQLAVLLRSGQVSNYYGGVSVLMADGSVREMVASDAVRLLPDMALIHTPPQKAPK